MRRSVRGWKCVQGREEELAALSLTSHCDQQTIVEYETEFHRHASSRELAPGEDGGAGGWGGGEWNSLSPPQAALLPGLLDSLWRPSGPQTLQHSVWPVVL